MQDATRDHFGGVVLLSQLCVDPRGSMYWNPKVHEALEVRGNKRRAHVDNGSLCEYRVSQ